MSFAIDPAEPIGRELARISVERLSEACVCIESRDAGLEARVHRGRTTCKKVRATLQLVREQHPRFCDRENERLRDAARAISPLRDAEVLVSAARSVKFMTPATKSARAALLRTLASHRRAILGDSARVEPLLANFGRQLAKSLGAFRRWSPSGKRIDSILPAVESSYRKARRLWKKSDVEAAGEDFHEWRKAVKSYGYHCRILQRGWPEATKPINEEIEYVADLLGREHDLTVLCQFMRQQSRARSTRSKSERGLRRLIDRQRSAMRKEASRRGRRIFAEKPGALSARLAAWWECQQPAGDAKPKPGS